MKPRSVVILTSIPPFSRYHGNVRRINDLIMDLLRAGFAVHVSYHRDGAYLLTENFPPGVTWDVYVPRGSWRIRRRLRDRSIAWSNRLLNRYGWFVNHPLDGWMDPAYVGYLRARFADTPPAAVIAEYVWMTGAFAAFPRDSLRLLDTIDVYAERKKLCHSRGVPYHEYSLAGPAECTGLNRADLVLAIAREEFAHFNALGLRADTLLFEPAFPELPAPGDDAPGANILFVASNNTANIQAGIGLLDAWARLAHGANGPQLHVVGLVCEALQPLNRAPNVVFHGPVTNLLSHYRNAALSVVPLDVGTGMSIKTIESLAHGVPVLSSATGARGLEDFVGHGIICYEGPDGLKDSLASLLADPARLAGARALLGGRLAAYVARTRAQRTELFQRIGTGVSGTA